jgi:hypothetical protein
MNTRKASTGSEHQPSLLGAKPTPVQNSEEPTSLKLSLVGNTDGATPPQDNAEPAAPLHLDPAQKAELDAFEQEADNYILADDDGDEPGASDEIKTVEVVKQLPKFVNFRSNPATTFEMWGTTDRQGMDDLVFVCSKSFAPNFEDDVDLRRVRFYETATTDGVVRLVYCFVAEKDARKPNLWLSSKEAALELAKTCWTTMRSRKKLQQYTYRPARKDYGEPKFTGLTRRELVDQLRKQGLVVEDKNHPFYKRATDSDE